jgi:hypothetical protein
VLATGSVLPAAAAAAATLKDVVPKMHATAYETFEFIAFPMARPNREKVGAVLSLYPPWTLRRLAVRSSALIMTKSAAENEWAQHLPECRLWPLITCLSGYCVAPSAVPTRQSQTASRLFNSCSHPGVCG